MENKLLIAFLIICTFQLGFKPIAESPKRGIAILVVSQYNDKPDPAKTLSVKHMVEVAGIPYTITRTVGEAIKEPVMIATEGFDGTNLTEQERQILRNYVAEGGILISPNFKDPNLFELFGISDEQFSRSRYTYEYDVSKSEVLFHWIDSENERIIPLGDSEKERAIYSRSYNVNGAEILAAFDDGSSAFIRNSYGKGYAYTFGISFREVIVRNQLNYDLSANRSYSNGFEPASDTFGLLLRGIVMEHIPNTIWKHTAPSNYSASVIITHDIDAESGMEWMNRFAFMEKEYGIKATYNITTHYIDDYLDGDYYTMYRNRITKLSELGHEIASHSVGHFPDFDTLPMGDLGETMSTYAPSYINGKTVEGSLLGELEVSKDLLEEDTPQNVGTFRSGYLVYHEKLINALDTLGYKFNSTFSGNDILSSYPYRALKNRSFNGDISNILEIPLIISDVININFTSESYKEIADMWLNVSEKYIANAAPVVLLVHPNNEFKYKALEAFIEGLPNDVTFQTTDSYGDFWLKRNKFDFYSELSKNSLTIHLKNEELFAEGISLKINNGIDLDDIIIKNESGDILNYDYQITEFDEVIIYNREPSKNTELIELKNSHSLKIYPNYPNPFRSRTTISYKLKIPSNVTIEVFNTLGVKVETIMEEVPQDKGTQWVELSTVGYSSGVYFYRVSTSTNSEVGKMVYIK